MEEQQRVIVVGLGRPSMARLVAALANLRLSESPPPEKKSTQEQWAELERSLFEVSSPPHSQYLWTSNQTANQPRSRSHQKRLRQGANKRKRRAR